MVLNTKHRPIKKTDHRKRTGNHHRVNSHSYRKAYWPYLPMLLVALFGFFLNGAMAQKFSVLGYATDMSVAGLLDSTNAQRTAGNLPPLTLNSKLAQAAQAKANDMAAKDYWSHNSPTGQTPWSFILAAGYNYELAGENLAYGFTTSAYTVDGWMNSPEHRANIMNSGYLDVGFGIINIPNYQGDGPETLVVAEYGKLPGETYSVPVGNPTPQPSVPISNPTPTPAPVAPTTTTPVAQAPAETKPVPTAPTPTPTKTNASEPATITPKVSQQPKGQSISRIQLVADGNASWSLLAVSIIIAVSFIFLLTRHGFAWHKKLVRGEKFILHHPLLDTAVVALIVVCVVLSQSAGLIL